MAEMMEECPDILSFSRSGLQHKVMKKLRQGKNPIEHALDLHGLTVDQARIELLEFLGECEAADIRYAIIVHGKGFRSKDKPVIKPMLNRWLRAADSVLGFHSAQPKDGGNGALYILLKKAQ
jgi:DNA-nicking Smr family endonuclease